MAGNLGIFLGGAVDQRNTTIQQGLQERTLQVQEAQAQREARRQAVESFTTNLGGLGDQAALAAERVGSQDPAVQSIVATMREQGELAVQNLLDGGDVEGARMVASNLDVQLLRVQNTQSAAEAAALAGETSATEDIARRDALIANNIDPATAAHSSDITSPSPADSPSSDIVDEQGNVTPTIQRLIRDQVGTLYGALFDQNNNFIIPGDEARLQEATEVQAEAVRLMTAMQGAIPPAQAVLIAQRNVRARNGQAPGDTASNPLPPPTSAQDAQEGKWYQLPDDRVTQYLGNGEFSDPQ